MEMQPLPVPVEFQAKLINDVPQIDGTIPKQMCVLEFMTVTGVSVYFYGKSDLKLFIDGLKEIHSRMTDSGRKLHLAKDIPRA